MVLHKNLPSTNIMFGNHSKANRERCYNTGKKHQNKSSIKQRREEHHVGCTALNIRHEFTNKYQHRCAHRRRLPVQHLASSLNKCTRSVDAFALQMYDRRALLLKIDVLPFSLLLFFNPPSISGPLNLANRNFFKTIYLRKSF